MPRAARTTHLTAGRNRPGKPAPEVLMDLCGRPDRLPMTREPVVRARRRADHPVAPLSSKNDFELVVGLEAVATDIEAFEPVPVPGLLRTEACARALIGHHASITPGVDAEVTREQCDHLPAMSDRRNTTPHVLPRHAGGCGAHRADQAVLRQPPALAAAYQAATEEGE